jgi:hypothetical protein
MYSSDRLQWKIKGVINQAQKKKIKIPMMDYFYLINPSK